MSSIIRQYELESMTPTFVWHPFAKPKLLIGHFISSSAVTCACLAVNRRLLFLTSVVRNDSTEIMPRHTYAWK